MNKTFIMAIVAIFTTFGMTSCGTLEERLPPIGGYLQTEYCAIAGEYTSEERITVRAWVLPWIPALKHSDCLQNILPIVKNPVGRPKGRVQFDSLLIHASRDPDGVVQAEFSGRLVLIEETGVNGFIIDEIRNPEVISTQWARED